MKNYVAIASRPIFADAATVIYAVEYGIDDAVLVGDICGDIRKVPHLSRIRYNMQGDAYFMHYGRREYLREYIMCRTPHGVRGLK